MIGFTCMTFGRREERKVNSIVWLCHEGMRMKNLEVGLIWLESDGMWGSMLLWNHSVSDTMLKQWGVELGFHCIILRSVLTQYKN